MTVVTKARKHPRFSVGDRVRLEYGGRMIRGLVVEDRGKLGGTGPDRFIVHTYHEPDLIVPIQRDADQLQPADEPEEPLDHENVIAYLKRPGLFAILMNNSPGGRDQPRVWLTRNSLGAITHTFLAERGGLGGATLPYWALGPRGKVRPEKQEEVLAFLTHFGLTREEAEVVIDTAWNGA
jgi:hypothetical protein